MAATLVMPCDCEHPAQDKMYGRGRRVHNQKGQKNAGKVACTVCGREKTAFVEAKKK